MFNIKKEVDAWLKAGFNAGLREFLKLEPEKQAFVMDLERLVRHGEWTKEFVPSYTGGGINYQAALGAGRVRIDNRFVLVAEDLHESHSIQVNECGDWKVFNQGKLAERLFNELHARLGNKPDLTEAETTSA